MGLPTWNHEAGPCQVHVLLHLLKIIKLTILPRTQMLSQGHWGQGVEANSFRDTTYQKENQQNKTNAEATMEAHCFFFLVAAWFIAFDGRRSPFTQQSKTYEVTHNGTVWKQGKPQHWVTMPEREASSMIRGHKVLCH